MAVAQTHPAEAPPRAAAPPYSPDLLARQLIVTAVPAAGRVYVAALIENVGMGSVTGPFGIAISVDLMRGGILTSFVQVFEVPATVRLAGRPVFAEAMAHGPANGISAFQTQYLTPKMDVPLYYRDQDPSATYTAEFLVDSDNQITESNEANNYYAWPGDFWFVSAEARRRSEPFVVERALAPR
jgi:hypothetical protein